MSGILDQAKTQGVRLAIGHIATRAAQMLSTIAMARLLVPHDFGKVAIAAVTWELMALAGNTGIAATLVHRRDDIEHLSEAAFWLNMTVSTILAIAAMVVSFGIAHFYNDPDIVPMIGLYALSFLILSMGTINAVLLTKEVSFGRLGFVDATVALASAIGAIGLALAGFGFWSLVLHSPVIALLRVALLRRMHPWRPSLRARPSLWPSLFGYGRWVLGSDLMTYISLNGDYMMTGKILGDRALGIYSMAYRIANWPVEAGVWMVARIAFPTLSVLQSNPAELARVFTRMLRLVALVAFPAIGILFVVTPDLITILFGEARWGEAAPLIRILLPYVLLRSISSPASQALMATGRARTAFYFGATVMPTLLVAVAIGTRFGATGVAVATSAVLGTAALFLLILSCRGLGIRPFQFFPHLGPGVLVAATGMGAASLVTFIIPQASDSVPLIGRFLLAVGSAGLGIWVCASRFFPEDYRSIVGNLGAGSVVGALLKLRRGIAASLALRLK